MRTVEIFKTNVHEPAESKRLIGRLLAQLPGRRINFDLSDCDRILRVEGESVCTETVALILRTAGFHCELLE